MTLDPKQLSIISEQLQKENVTEFLEIFLIEYANDVKRTSHLLALIPAIAEKQLKIKNEEVIEHALATSLLIGTTDKNKHIDFPTLLYTCKAVFPSGNSDCASPYGKRFFKKFIEAIKTKSEWNYESEEDWKWVREIANCEEWMQSVIKQNLD